MKKLFLLCCLFLGMATAGRAQSASMTGGPAEKARALQKELKLSADQTTKVSAIYEESAKKYDQIKVNEHGNTDKMLVAIAPLRAATIKKIKGILSHSQSAKYDELLKEKDSKGLNGGWSGGWSTGDSGS